MAMPRWVLLHPQANQEMLGYLPGFLDAGNPAPAKEQLDRNYRHGGGWNPFKGHKMSKDKLELRYPGDPPMRAIGVTTLRDETIIMYESGWVAIIQPDGSYEVARMD